MRFPWPSKALRRKSRMSPRTAGKHNPYRPHVERMEDRCLLSVFTVTNTEDAGAGSVRQVLLDANTTPGADRSAFDIPGLGVHTIAPATPLRRSPTPRPSMATPSRAPGRTRWPSAATRSCSSS